MCVRIFSLSKEIQQTVNFSWMVFGVFEVAIGCVFFGFEVIVSYTFFMAFKWFVGVSFSTSLFWLCVF